jgi:hypothetical protein
MRAGVFVAIFPIVGLGKADGNARRASFPNLMPGGVGGLDKQGAAFRKMPFRTDARLGFQRLSGTFDSFMMRPPGCEVVIM